ncbi:MULTISPECIES: ABC transporter permease [unclassified Acetobacterium]|jgi:ABC-type nitrate/sulfonate/bicarbonate transport system permease component|uniref:ABC transporter permease n=1 Tax=unclassified Acetobacterium TaxID=2638182 RepID=UPI000DBEC8C1|nr:MULTISPECIES: ABC transporter permease [unclassified Acetobacterium]AWW26629.1 ABC transporter permease [Acetobacterium sp. KB-1]MDZ5725292.1 ABC transporter permease [Acetobacterium sp. K1/6]
MRKYQNISDKLIPIIFILAILILWELVVNLGVVERYTLPSPSDIVNALIVNGSDIMMHTGVTFFEGMTGLLAAVFLALIMAVAMDQFPMVKKAIYPVLVISQTVPIIVIAPLLAMWFGFGIAPKIFVVVLVCFFPITVNLIEGLQSVDGELINLVRSMGATKGQIFAKIKFPSALPYFFSGLKIAATYSIMGAVIGEWLGGKAGLGVYMLRARHAFALDLVFASIVVIVILSIILFYGIAGIQRALMPWEKLKEEEE